MKYSKIMMIGTLLCSLILAGCTSVAPTKHELLITPTITASPTSKNIRAEYMKLDPEEAQALISDEVILLDVRTQEEYDEGHIAEAILLPDYEVKDKIESIVTDKKQTIIVYCRSGRRSELASKELIAMGYEKVFDLGGIFNWSGEIVGNWLYPSYYNYFGEDLPSDIITPIDLTTVIKINDQMPEFTFHMTGNNIKKYGLSNDKTKYYIMFDDNEVDKITITDPTGALVQTIDNLTTANPATEEEKYGLSFEDWNFDGYIDIGLWTYPGGSMRNDPHYYWLWDNSIGQYVKNDELIEISNFSTISINTEEKRLECYTRYGAGEGGSQYFKYIDGNYVLVYTYSLELVESPDEEGKRLRHITSSELVDGVMKVIEDYYEDFE